MNKIRIHKNIPAGEEVWTGIPGQYVSAPEAPGTYSFVEVCHEDESGQLVHDYYTFERE